MESLLAYRKHFLCRMCRGTSDIYFENCNHFYCLACQFTPEFEKCYKENPMVDIHYKSAIKPFYDFVMGLRFPDDRKAESLVRLNLQCFDLEAMPPDDADFEQIVQLKYYELVILNSLNKLARSRDTPVVSGHLPAGEEERGTRGRLREQGHGGRESLHPQGRGTRQSLNLHDSSRQTPVSVSRNCDVTTQTHSSMLNSTDVSSAIPVNGVIAEEANSAEENHLQGSIFSILQVETNSNTHYSEAADIRQVKTEVSQGDRPPILVISPKTSSPVTKSRKRKVSSQRRKSGRTVKSKYPSLSSNYLSLAAETPVEPEELLSQIEESVFQAAESISQEDISHSQADTVIRDASEESRSGVSAGQCAEPRVGERMDDSPSIAESRSNERWGEGPTSLHWACKHCDLAYIKFLLNRGDDINYVDNRAKQTPLHYAVLSGMQIIIATLLKAGATVDVPNHEHETALHLAVKKNNTIAADLLLEYGADPDLEDTSGYTPRSLASMINDHNSQLSEIVDSLRCSPSARRKRLRTNQMVNLIRKDLKPSEIGLWPKFLELAEYAETKDTYCASLVVVSGKLSQQFNGHLLKVMATGAPIITFQWVTDSLEKRQPLPWKKYELQPAYLYGLPKARINFSLKQPGLFYGCQVMVGPTHIKTYKFKGVSLNLRDIRRLVEKSDGMIINTIPDVNSPELLETVPYHGVGTMKKCSCIIIYLPGAWPAPETIVDTPHVKCLPFEYLIKCITNFTLE